MNGGPVSEQRVGGGGKSELIHLKNPCFASFSRARSRCSRLFSFSLEISSELSCSVNISGKWRKEKKGKGHTDEENETRENVKRNFWNCVGTKINSVVSLLSSACSIWEYSTLEKLNIADVVHIL